MKRDPYAAELEAVTTAIRRLRELVESVTDWTPTRVNVWECSPTNVEAEWVLFADEDDEERLAVVSLNGWVHPLGLTIGIGHDEEIRAWFADLRQQCGEDDTQ